MSTVPASRSPSIDYGVCSGHGRCYQVAPAVFEADEEGRGRVKLQVVAGEALQALDRAVRLCPEQAISAAPIGDGATLS
jgi:ferredoxin